MKCNSHTSPSAVWWVSRTKETHLCSGSHCCLIARRSRFLVFLRGVCTLSCMYGCNSFLWFCFLLVYTCVVYCIVGLVGIIRAVGCKWEYLSVMKLDRCPLKPMTRIHARAHTHWKSNFNMIKITVWTLPALPPLFSQRIPLTFPSLWMNL